MSRHERGGGKPDKADPPAKQRNEPASDSKNVAAVVAYKLKRLEAFKNMWIASMVPVGIAASYLPAKALAGLDTNVSVTGAVTIGFSLAVTNAGLAWWAWRQRKGRVQARKRIEKELEPKINELKTKVKDLEAENERLRQEQKQDAEPVDASAGQKPQRKRGGRR